MNIYITIYLLIELWHFWDSIVAMKATRGKKSTSYRAVRSEQEGKLTATGCNPK